MGKREDYRARLRASAAWEPYLLAESGLPGPRANLELAQAVADEGDAERFRRYLGFTAAVAPTNSPDEFIAFCGVVGLGRLLAEGDDGLLPVLRQLAADPRWRIREAVAMALQRLGAVNMDRLIGAMQDWAGGGPLVQRAAAAALCEPGQLGRPEHARAVLGILDQITASLTGVADRRSEPFLALRKGLGYCWSVAVVALPDEGQALMERWLASPDKDVQWIMRSNLKKARLARLDAAWVQRCLG